MKIFLASNNPNKKREIKEILQDLGVEILTPQDLGIDFFVEEDGTSFQENAHKKAIEGLRLSGLPTLGEDSGIEIEYLGGKPGTASHRFAGLSAKDEENILKVLSLLEGVPIEKRKARFRCIICFLFSFKKVLFFEGRCEGTIATQKRGNLGFGYDPIFIPQGFNKTFGELGERIKNKISHRVVALNKLKEYLKGLKMEEK